MVQVAGVGADLRAGAYVLQLRVYGEALNYGKMNAQQFAEVELATRQLQARCAIGHPPSAIEESNSLHADCYGHMGKLLEVIRQSVAFEGIVVTKVTTLATIEHLRK